jgi:S-adenosyl methyltransferase
MAGARPVPHGVDISVPAPARIYDYLLGGENNFAADRAAADQILRAVPEIRDTAWSNRGFHQRAAKWIAEQGVRQFIDIGSGLPTVGNTHQVVQQVWPETRVAYVDNDPLVRAYSQALLAPDGTTMVLLGDLRDPDGILGHPAILRLIDFGQPAGLLMTGVLMFVADESDPYQLVTRYLRALPPGSYLSVSHLTADHKPAEAVKGFRAVFDSATERLYFRSKAQVARFFTGLDLVPPYQGAAAELCYTGLWGAEDPVAADSDGSRWLWCGVGRSGGPQARARDVIR